MRVPGWVSLPEGKGSTSKAIRLNRLARKGLDRLRRPRRAPAT
jgi:hypothetical protein